MRVIVVPANETLPGVVQGPTRAAGHRHTARSPRASPAGAPLIQATVGPSAGPSAGR